jgi:REP element-mobilizing transposase RayT
MNIAVQGSAAQKYFFCHNSQTSQGSKRHSLHNVFPPAILARIPRRASCLTPVQASSLEPKAPDQASSLESNNGQNHKMPAQSNILVAKNGALRRTSIDDSLYFLTFTIVDWLDVFTRLEYKDWLARQIIYCQANKGLELYAYVIMTNHVHLVARMNEGLSMSDFLRDFKSFTAKGLTGLIADNITESRRDWMLAHFGQKGADNPLNKQWQFWQNGSHPTALYTREVIDQKINYIHQNPVRAGFVAEDHHYIYSSASPDSPIKVLDI